MKHDYFIGFKHEGHTKLKIKINLYIKKYGIMDNEMWKVKEKI